MALPPSATLSGSAAATVTLALLAGDVSSFTMVPVTRRESGNPGTGSRSLLNTALVSAPTSMMNVSSGSAVSSPFTVTVTVLLVSPGLNVSTKLSSGIV